MEKSRTDPYEKKNKIEEYERYKLTAESTTSILPTRGESYRRGNCLGVACGGEHGHDDECLVFVD